MLQSFGSGPLVLRVGGGSTDKQVTVPEPRVWQALSKLHEATGMKFILGLNFFYNNVALARAQMDAAKAGLPQGSIMSFEIGNEPDYYSNKSSTHWNGTKYFVVQPAEYQSCCFHTEWLYMAEQLACRNGPDSCSPEPQFTGPVWGHVNLRWTTMDWFLRTNGKYVLFTSVHWYKATSETYNTAVTLLDEDPIRQEMTNLKKIVEVSNGYGKPLRVAEMNTISNSGREGVSDVFAAALWTVDASFEVAAAGGTGVNLHQGAGQNLYAAVIRWYDNGKLASPMLRPPFFGMLMFQMAVRGGTRLLGQTTTSLSTPTAYKWLKVWSLQDLNSKEIRWVVINKDPTRAGTATLKLTKNLGYTPTAKVLRLVAPGDNPLSATTGITLAGVTYGNGGVPRGTRKVEQIDVVADGSGLKLTLYMPPASAALVRLPKAGWVAGGAAGSQAVARQPEP
eukprot:GHUV01018129.1.p1 GENE.GHUV01018129.1~~GHUV01018129.1.p1  ORF type:complete len:450 (+),score=80.81 GHUV01018129.1:440-1789(+)